MEIETIYGGMVKQIRDLGDFCRGNWACLTQKISAIQERETSVEEAVSELIRKDIETTKIVKDQIMIIESTARALNWFRTNLEDTRAEQNSNFKRITDWIQTFEHGNHSEQIHNDVRQLNVATGLIEDKINQVRGNYETLQTANTNMKAQMNSLNSKVKEAEALSKSNSTNMNNMEDRLLLVESRIKEMLKRQNELGALDEKVREKGRNILIVEEEIEKIKNKYGKLEEKLSKSNGSKLSKGEKSFLNDLEVDIVLLKEKTQSMETILNHLNEVTNEDFVKRFKKEIIDNTDSPL